MELTDLSSSLQYFCSFYFAFFDLFTKLWCKHALVCFLEMKKTQLLIKKDERERERGDEMECIETGNHRDQEFICFAPFIIYNVSQLL